MERLTERYDITPDGESDVWVKQHDYISAARKLCDYEDLEEQGLLVRLPCPIGTTVWDICGMDIRENVLSGIECGKDGKQFLWANHDEWLGELNDLVFLTREEAVQKGNRLKSTRGADLYQPGLPYSCRQALGRTDSLEEAGSYQNSGMF